MDNLSFEKNDIIYTKACAGDLDEVAAMLLAATAGLDRIGVHQWDELYPDREIVREDISLNRLWLGRAAGELVCSFVLDTECDAQYTNGKWTHPDAHYCVVHRLCVHPRCQNRGIGRLTMKHIEHLAAVMGFDEIRLDTFTRNPYSIRLYEHLGYRTVGVAHWRMGDFILMEKSIKRLNDPEATDHENETKKES